jgi:iron complex transport system permease protein
MSSARRPRLRGKLAFSAVMLLLLAGLLASVVLAVGIGKVPIPFARAYRIIGHELFGTGESSLGSGSEHDIIWQIRLPRTILAVFVGMGLSVVGCVMQAICKNPMADPYILGVSSGATLGATASILLGVGAAFGSNATGVCACLGAFGANMLVQAISGIGGRANSTKLILAGIAVSAVAAAFSDTIVYFCQDKQGIQSLTFWSMGSLAGAKWGSMGAAILTVAAGTAFFCTQYRTLNLMLLGDETAVTLGTDLCRWRTAYLVLTSAMIGMVVCEAGMIGFVGLLVPHIVRMLSGTDHRRLVPMCSLAGAIFLVWADVAARSVLKSGELPIGILVSLIGAPFFLWLVFRKAYSFGGGA